VLPASLLRLLIKNPPYLIITIFIIKLYHFVLINNPFSLRNKFFFFCLLIAQR